MDAIVLGTETKPGDAAPLVSDPAELPTELDDAALQAAAPAEDAVEPATPVVSATKAKANKGSAGDKQGTPPATAKVTAAGMASPDTPG